MTNRNKSNFDNSIAELTIESYIKDWNDRFVCDAQDDLIHFSDIGLDVSDNILAPLICECCGEPVNIILETKEEVQEFCGEMCNTDYSNHCLVMAIGLDGDIIVAFRKYEGGTVIGTLRPECDGVATKDEINEALSVFVECTSAEEELDGYGLLQEVEPNAYTVIVD